MSVTRATTGVITSLYLASLGFSAPKIGTFFVGVTITSALMSSTSGLLSDRVGRKPFVIAVPMLNAVALAAQRSTAFGRLDSALEAALELL